VVKEKNAGTGAGYTLYSEIIKQLKDQVRRVDGMSLEHSSIDFI
jgi:hypothetical protein